MLVHPQFNPVAIHLGPLAVHWYGLMYVVGFVAAWEQLRQFVAGVPQGARLCGVRRPVLLWALPGLVVDKYGDNIVLEFYSFAMYRLASFLEAAFREHFPKAVFHHRASSYTETMEGFTLKPSAAPNKTVRIIENGVLFEVDLAGGHKTGFFCDQRDNRLHASTLAAGRSVLDICAYTGGFGLYAAKLGGAKDVTCVELDPEASSLSKRNANINGVKIDAVCSDAFPYMRQMALNSKRYGLVILDPYKLVASREDRERGIEVGANAYIVKSSFDQSNLLEVIRRLL